MAKATSPFDTLKADEANEVTVTAHGDKVHLTVRRDGVAYVGEGKTSDEAAEKIAKVLP